MTAQLSKKWSKAVLFYGRACAVQGLCEKADLIPEFSTEEPYLYARLCLVYH